MRIIVKPKNPQESSLTMISGTLCFDWELAGFKPQSWPAALKDSRVDGVVEVESLCAHLGDPWVNPASGGVIGKLQIAAKLGKSERQLHREIRCGSADFIRRQGKLYGTNVASINAFGTLNNSASAAAWTRNSLSRCPPKA